MNWTTGSKQTSAMGLGTCSVLAILAASWPAKAACPTKVADIPVQTIKIYNDSTAKNPVYIFPELEVGLTGMDQWIQMTCDIKQAQTGTLTYATTLTNRFYINDDKGIGPGKSVWITVPLYTQLVGTVFGTVDGTKPNQFAEWWQFSSVRQPRRR